MQMFSSEFLPPADDPNWQSFIKVVPTKMMRIEGPFIVQTSEGPLTCDDGWLAIDARGYPYPLADSEKELIYRPADAVSS